MRKKFALFIAFSLLAALCACGGSGEPSPSPAEPAPVPEVAEEPPQQEEASFAAPVEPFFITTLDMGRLYAVPVSGGEPHLLADKYTLSFDRCGDILWAAFDDGSFARLNLATGATDSLDISIAQSSYRLHAFEGGFIAESFSMREGNFYWIYRETTGRLEQILPNEYLGTFSIVGNELLAQEYMDGDYLVARDLDTLEEVWKLDADRLRDICFLGDGVTALSYDDTTPYRLDPETHTLQPLPLPGSFLDSRLLYSWDNCLLTQGSYSEGYGLYLLREGARQQLDIDPGVGYVQLSSGLEDKVLLVATDYGHSDAGGDIWYTWDTFYVVDMRTGALEEIAPQGQYAALFAAGDFPVMDSSTARQPVTSQIYAFFCESTGAGGSVPLCSTTHGAWLNIADGGADIALLAAPTQEERDYLQSRNVEVEMKLYGGDGLVFIGNEACGVTDLTLEQVRGIYRGEITNWAQLGGVDQPIRVLYRDDQSGSQRLFEQLLWGDEPVPDLEALGFDRLDEMSSIVSQCLYEPYTIGYSIMTYLRDVYGQEALLAFSLEGVDATPENVAAQRYPLSTRGYAVIRADEPEDSPARRLYNWFGSPLSDYILTINGITPLHE